MTERTTMDEDAMQYLAESPSCRNCRQRLGHRILACNAFPDRIPIAIWNASSPIHREPIEGDRGFQFEHITDEEYQAVLTRRRAARERFMRRTDEIRAEQGEAPTDWSTFPWRVDG